LGGQASLLLDGGQAQRPPATLEALVPKVADNVDNGALLRDLYDSIYGPEDQQRRPPASERSAAATAAPPSGSMLPLAARVERITCFLYVVLCSVASGEVHSAAPLDYSLLHQWALGLLAILGPSAAPCMAADASSGRPLAPTALAAFGDAMMNGAAAVNLLPGNPRVRSPLLPPPPLLTTTS
jgi:hypothetical protein